MINDSQPTSPIIDDVVDDSGDEEIVPLEKYAISSFGIDFDVEGLVRRLRKDDIFVPSFQRNYVWKISEASQFIESLLLGLPVPGVFLAREGETQRMLIIDGQQRLKTLQFYYDGYFRPNPIETKRRVFHLVDVQSTYLNKTYNDLSEEDQRRLDNAVIHSTIIKQESPDEEEDTSLFYIFGRLNSGGRKLNAQEIRSALYHGPFIDLIEQTLNKLDEWRKLFGAESERLKDHELIIRFLTLYFDHQSYQRPMENFLNKFCARHQNANKEFLDKCIYIFENTIRVAYDILGLKAFRPIRSINAAAFDSIMVGLAKRLEKGPIHDNDSLRSAHSILATNEQFVLATSRSTADETNVNTRIKLAIDAFSNSQ
jgi:hypothetical protein